MPAASEAHCPQDADPTGRRKVLLATKSSVTKAAMSPIQRLRPFALAAAVLLAGTAHGADAPYEARLYRLGEVLGSLHYLRNLCGEESNAWRDQMEALIVAEEPTAEKRRRLVASFNRGYRSYAEIHIACTPAAAEAITRFMKEGEVLARETAVTYGN